LNVTKSITSSKTITATTFQGSLAASNAFAGSLNLGLGLHATGDLTSAGRELITGTGSSSNTGAWTADPAQQ
ncbi:MAG: hypothetical protein LAP21_27910, partial [Acidobacteriia bacterium]|nr:hypothetical protein [Terriglobia bacterium]